MNQAERELVEHAAAGTVCDLSGRDDDERRVRAEVIYELCVGTKWPVHTKGARLAGAMINDPLDFEHATLRTPLRLSGCALHGLLNFTSATVPELSLTASHLTQPLFMRRAKIIDDLNLVGVRLMGTDVDGDALMADGLHVGGSAFLRDGFEAAGTICLRGATIDGPLDMRAAKLTDTNGNAVAADGFHVGGPVFLRDGFEAAGAIRLIGATIDQLDMSGALLTGTNADGVTVVAERLHVRGSAFLGHGFQATGIVNLGDAKIDGLLSFEGARPFEILVLTGTYCADLVDDEATWPPRGRLGLRGFRFDGISLATEWDRRLEWLRRQGFIDWSPDPYEQLASHFMRVGDESAARRIQVAKHDDELTHLKTTDRKGSLGYRFWRRPFGWLVGYGYRRHRAGWLLAATLLAAGLLFRWAEAEGAMVPNEPFQAGDSSATCGEAYPCFNSAVYGADVVLPIIDFGQDSAWRPIETSSPGPLWIWARWAFIAVGWALASVFVAAFTGLVQRT